MQETGPFAAHVIPWSLGQVDAHECSTSSTEIPANEDACVLESQERRLHLQGVRQHRAPRPHRNGSPVNPREMRPAFNVTSRDRPKAFVKYAGDSEGKRQQSVHRNVDRDHPSSPSTFEVLKFG